MQLNTNLLLQYLNQDSDLLSSTRIRIKINDLNEHQPKFIGKDGQGAFPAAVSEESPAGSVVASVFAVDRDGTSPYNTVCILNTLLEAYISF